MLMIDHRFEEIIKTLVTEVQRWKQNSTDMIGISKVQHWSKAMEAVQVRHSSWTVSDTRAPGRMPFANFAAWAVNKSNGFTACTWLHLSIAFHRHNKFTNSELGLVVVTAINKWSIQFNTYQYFHHTYNWYIPAYENWMELDDLWQFHDLTGTPWHCSMGYFSIVCLRALALKKLVTGVTPPLKHRGSDAVLGFGVLKGWNVSFARLQT